MNKKLLVTGGTGLLGKGLTETKIPGWDIVSTHLRDYTVKDTHAEHVICDIRNAGDIEKLFSKHHFDAVIHAAGIANVDYVESHLQESRDSNINGTRIIAELCKKHSAYMIYVSTNAVFDGKNPPFSETSKTNPVNEYGKIKLECEKIALGTNTDALVFRPILMYGWAYPQSRANPASWLVAKLSNGEEIKLVTDVYENPLYYIQCGNMLWQALELKPSGVIHAAGREKINRYEFGLKVAKIFGFTDSKISPVDSSFFPSIAPRPKNTTFDVTKMQAKLKIHPLSIDEGLIDMLRRRK